MIPIWQRKLNNSQSMWDITIREETQNENLPESVRQNLAKYLGRAKTIDLKKKERKRQKDIDEMYQDLQETYASNEHDEARAVQQQMGELLIQAMSSTNEEESEQVLEEALHQVELAEDRLEEAIQGADDQKVKEFLVYRDNWKNQVNQLMRMFGQVRPDEKDFDFFQKTTPQNLN